MNFIIGDSIDLENVTNLQKNWLCAFWRLRLIIDQIELFVHCDNFGFYLKLVCQDCGTDNIELNTHKLRKLSKIKTLLPRFSNAILLIKIMRMFLR